MANPFLVMSWFFIKRRPIVAVILSGIAVGISLAFLSYKEIMVDEAGHYGEITGYALGYWLWCCSSVTVFLGSLWYTFNKTRKRKNDI